MPNLDMFSEQITGGDAGRWRAAVGRAGELVGTSGRDELGTDPAREIPVVTAPLLVYAIAAEQGAPIPGAVTLADVASWFSSVRQRGRELDVTWPADSRTGDPVAGLAEMLIAAGPAARPRRSGSRRCCASPVTTFPTAVTSPPRGSPTRWLRRGPRW